MKTSWFLIAMTLSIPILGEEPGVVGRRPYEVESANRKADDHVPLEWEVHSGSLEALRVTRPGAEGLAGTKGYHLCIVPRSSPRAFLAAFRGSRA